MSNPLLMLGPGGDFVTCYDQASTGEVGRLEGTQGANQAGMEQDAPVAIMDELPDESPRTFAAVARAAKAGKCRFVVPNRGANTGAMHSEAVSATTSSAPTSIQVSAVLESLDSWLEAQQDVLRDMATALAARTNARTAGRVSAPAVVFTPAHAAHAGSNAVAGADVADVHPPIPANTTFGQEVGHEPYSQATSHPYSDPRSAALPRLFTNASGTGGRTGRQQSHDVRARRGAGPKGSTPPPIQQGSLFGG